MNDQQFFVKMVLDNWQGQVNAMSTLLGKLSDEQLMNEIAPGRNRAVYLLGHLVAVHDLMLPLLRFEEVVYPDLQPVFVDAPDRAFSTMPPVKILRKQWSAINERLTAHFNALPTSDWFTRHANVSEEDFAKEPKRNRLNVVIGRTSHLTYHRGQLILINKIKS
jgi:uncharacterized damage-inducible protein DinB